MRNGALGHRSAPRSMGDGQPAQPGHRLAALACASLVAACVLWSGVAHASGVRGKVTGLEKLLPDVYQEASKPDARRFTWREPSPTVRPDFRVLAANPTRDLCIAAISSQAVPKHEPIKVVLSGGRTAQTTIVVPPGTVLSFENHDPFPHRFFLVGGDAFKADDMQPGSHRDWSAPSQGRFEFRDELFPSVRFWVVVDPGVLEVVYPSRTGSFAFQNLPSGDYYLKAFFQGKQVGRPVAVVAKGKEVELKEPINVAEGGEGK